MSGYTADIISKSGVRDGVPNFLPKPITTLDLLRKVREVLDS